MANRRLKRMELSQECAEALEKHHLEFAKVGTGPVALLSFATLLVCLSVLALLPPG